MRDSQSNGWKKLGSLKKRTHHYTRYANQLEPIIVDSRNGAIVNTKSSERAKWVAISELGDYPMPSVYRKIAVDLREWIDNQT